MYNIILFLIIFLSFLLVLVIMVQNPKGGGLASTFGGDSQQIGGVKKTTDFLDRSTWILASLLFLLILFSNITLNSGSDVNESELLNNSDDIVIEEILEESSNPELDLEN
ncbi:MAG: preprotein translocase subunit SecG [Bacteroidota bacterium]|jgi:preprotein translocase subunit SecG|nr:preprotein translocase subunit SecG [Bacteroidota bacterium]|tara:strand:+ start:238 stop:567 length:330 start_codon:yes stop_codon:yes gene_type:complete